MKINFRHLNIWNKYFDRKQQILLLLILVIGVFLRLINTFATQLWRDEIYIILTSRYNSLINLLFQKHWDTCHPPGYFLFLYFWQKINVNSIFLRIPGIILSILILYLIPVLAKKISLKYPLFPFLSLFFFSFSHAQISLNMVARPYPFVILFMIASLIFFFELLEIKKDQDKQKKIIFFSIINFFAFFFDYSVIWLFLSYIFFWLFHYIFFGKKEKHIKAILFRGLIYTGFLSMLIFPIFIKGLSNCYYLNRYDKETVNQGLVFSLKVVLPFFTSLTEPSRFFSNNPLNEISLYNKIYFIVICSLIGLFIMMIKDIKKGFFMFVALIPPVLISYFYSLFIGSVFKDRNLVLVNIILIFLLAYFFSIIFKKVLKILILIILLFYLINFFLSFPGLHYVDPPYDFLTLHKKIYSSLEKEEKIIYTHAPLFMFEHLRYYNLFYPIKNLEIFDLSQLKKDRENSLLKESVKTKVFYVDFLYEKNTGNQYMPEDFSIIYDLNCPINKRHFIDYIYLIECL